MFLKNGEVNLLLSTPEYFRIKKDCYSPLNDVGPIVSDEVPCQVPAMDVP